MVSVQLARPERRAWLLIIRRSWVRAPPAPPAVLIPVADEPWTGLYTDVSGVMFEPSGRIWSHRVAVERAAFKSRLAASTSITNVPPANARRHFSAERTGFLPYRRTSAMPPASAIWPVASPTTRFTIMPAGRAGADPISAVPL